MKMVMLLNDEQLNGFKNVFMVLYCRPVEKKVEGEGGGVLFGTTQPSKASC